MFFPRGGSAHVARALARELPAHGWDVTVVVGLARRPRRRRALLRGLDVARGATSTPATRRCTPPTRTAPTPPTASSPPSTTTPTRPTSPPGARALEDAGAADADVLHLHHLTPIHEAAARVAPDVPVVGHLHGTELLMLERIADGPPDGLGARRGVGARMRRWARRCERLLLLSPQPARARRARCWASIRRAASSPPTASTPSASRRATVDRAAFWRQHLVDEPQGWRPGPRRGLGRLRPSRRRAARRRRPSCCRSAASPRSSAWGCSCAPSPARAALRDRPRLTGPRRRLPGGVGGRAPLRRDRARPARATSTSPAGTSTTSCPSSSRAADAVVLSSVREQFGSALVEGMACGLPAIAVDRFGPADIVARRDGLAGGTRRRGGARRRAGAGDRPPRGAPAPRRAARRDVTARFAWPALADRARAGSSPRSPAAADGRAVAATDS